jgi:glutathione reductase (NADPH)
MATQKFDVVIIGGGNAGMGVTTPARNAGLSVALLEPDMMGGTCPNRGCTPKKFLVAAAHALDEIERAKTHMISVGKPTLDWQALIAREQGMVKDLPVRMGGAMVNRGVTLIREFGRFVEPNLVAAGDDVLEAEHIVVATGSRTRTLPIPGAELMITSDEVLSEETQPRDVVFIGGGVIAFEFAHVYQRAGTKVTILEVAPKFLANFDEDAVTQIIAEGQRIGIDERANIKVIGIERVGERLRVVFEEDGKEQAIEVDRVINGAGRVANLDRLDLEAGGIATERGRIRTDAYLHSTSNPTAWACGDALAGKAQLSPIATYEGSIVGNNIAGLPARSPNYSVIPSCVFTVPTLATVGLSEAAARERGLELRVETNDIASWLSGQTYGETAAWAKVIVDKNTDLVLGAHLIGHGGDELIHLFAMAMRHKITAAEMKSAVYAFPTFAADIRSML